MWIGRQLARIIKRYGKVEAKDYFIGLFKINTDSDGVEYLTELNDSIHAGYRRITVKGVKAKLLIFELVHITNNEDIAYPMAISDWGVITGVCTFEDILSRDAFNRAKINPIQINNSQRFCIRKNEIDMTTLTIDLS